MYDLIVGGYLPGTNIQISLVAWMAISTLLFGIFSIAWLEYKNRQVNEPKFPQRIVFNASELHYRITPQDKQLPRIISTLQEDIAGIYSAFLEQVHLVLKNIHSNGWLQPRQ